MGGIANIFWREGVEKKHSGTRAPARVIQWVCHGRESAPRGAAGEVVEPVARAEDGYEVLRFSLWWPVS